MKKLNFSKKKKIIFAFFFILFIMLFGILFSIMNAADVVYPDLILVEKDKNLTEDLPEESFLLNLKKQIFNTSNSISSASIAYKPTLDELYWIETISSDPVYIGKSQIEYFDVENNRIYIFNIFDIDEPTTEYFDLNDKKIHSISTNNSTLLYYFTLAQSDFKYLIGIGNEINIMDLKSNTVIKTLDGTFPAYSNDYVWFQNKDEKILSYNISTDEINVVIDYEKYPNGYLKLKDPASEGQMYSQTYKVLDSSADSIYIFYAKTTIVSGDLYNEFSLIKYSPDGKDYSYVFENQNDPNRDEYEYAKSLVPSISINNFEKEKMDYETKHIEKIPNQFKDYVFVDIAQKNDSNIILIELIDPAFANVKRRDTKRLENSVSCILNTQKSDNASCIKPAGDSIIF